MFIILLIAVVLFLFIKEFLSRRNSFHRELEQDYSQLYKRKYVFSLNEKSAYLKLASWAHEHGYDVFPKMRLADVIEPRGKEHYLSLFRKISQKHVDFVICDYDCRVKFIIELDDNSHKQQERISRDTFVDQACLGAGYTIIHTRAITEDFLNNLS